MVAAKAEAAGAGDRIRAAHERTPARTSFSDEPHETRSYPVVSREALAPGFVLGPITRTVTQDRIDRYAVASGDYNPIHLDHIFAARSAFGSTIAHGMLLLSYLSILLAREFGSAWLDTGALKVKFRNPAHAGATVTASGRVERLDEDHGVQYAVCALRLDDSAGDTLITGDARVDVL
jgi:acyl dehydratase